MAHLGHDGRQVGLTDVELALARIGQHLPGQIGRPVEQGTIDDVLENPRHPYTKALLSATPKADPTAQKQRIKLQGELPSPLNVPPGCAFAPRCWKVQDRCRAERPTLDSSDHPAACFFPEG